MSHRVWILWLGYTDLSRRIQQVKSVYQIVIVLSFFSHFVVVTHMLLSKLQTIESGKGKSNEIRKGSS